MKIGLQLYSIREEMEKDMEGTLKKVSEMGYECVEFAGYFGHTAEEVKEICDKYNLEAVSVHQKHNVFLEDPESSVKYIKTLGVKYCAIPWVPLETFTENFDNFVSEVKKVGKLLKDNGIKLCYHNHDFEFQNKIGDKYILDVLYETVSRDLLLPELDLCWVNYGGADPIEYIKKYGQDEEIIHIKDFVCKKLGAGPVYSLIDENGKEQKVNSREANGFEFRPVGQGRQDVKALLDAMEGTAIKYLIVEQDGHPSGDALKDAKESIDYLKKIGC